MGFILFSMQLKMMRWINQNRHCTQLQRMIIWGQNATTIKQSLSLTTSLLKGSGKLFFFSTLLFLSVIELQIQFYMRIY